MRVIQALFAEEALTSHLFKATEEKKKVLTQEEEEKRKADLLAVRSVSPSPSRLAS